MFRRYLSLVGLVNAVGEERPEVGAAGGHDGAMHGEVPVLHAQHGVAQLPALAQVVQHVARLQHKPTTLHLLRRLTTRRCPHSLLSAGAAAYRLSIDICCRRSRCSAANQPHAAAAAVDRWDRQTDGTGAADVRLK